MDKPGMIMSSTRVQKERPVNTLVQNLNRRVASNATHYKCWCVWCVCVCVCVWVWGVCVCVLQ